jgi:hypothetical protein
LKSFHSVELKVLKIFLILFYNQCREKFLSILHADFLSQDFLAKRLDFLMSNYFVHFMSHIKVFTLEKFILIIMVFAAVKAS